MAGTDSVDGTPRWQGTCRSRLPGTGILVSIVDDALVIEHSGPRRWPRMSLSLADVATIEVIDDIAPLRYGGWGYRGSLRLYRRAALVLRRGPGLRVKLRDGRVFVVTVDDPQGAVAAAAPQLSGSTIS